VVRGIVGFVDLRHGTAAGEALDHMRKVSDGRFVGVRQSSAWDPSPDVPTAKSRPGEGLLRKPQFHAGFAELARRDMSFDAWLYHPQLRDVAVLADTFPDTRIILCHLGAPLAMGPYKAKRAEVLDVWRRYMTELQKRPNIFVKLGGIGTRLLGDPVDVTGIPGVEPTSEQVAEYWGSEVRWCVETFGADRCMFESNFPADGRLCSYRVLWNAFKRMVADASPDEKRALFAGTANRAYGLST
jgi:predicted TIM-barrel fold metal-dependent hydrolase